MAKENEETTETTEEEKLSFKTADELSSFLMDLQGQMVNMQQTIDKLSPVQDETEETTEETPEEPKEEELTEEEISEIDSLLQSK